jgi:urease accessory protein
VIASASAVIGAGGRLGRVVSDPPLTLRRIHSDDPETCALALVGSAAGPLPGDEYSLTLTVEDSARATLCATGASIAQGEGARPSLLRLSASVGAGSALVADPGALIVCAGSQVEVTVNLDLSVDAQVEWHETVVLGRTAESTPGAAGLSWDVRRDGRPVLVQRVDLRDPVVRRWAIAGNRVLTTVLVSGPGVRAETVVASPTAVAQRIDAATVLITVLAADGASASTHTEALLRRVRGELVQS